jgi:heme A synthase
MSKKETRRAARDAFPKGKSPTPAAKPSGGKYSSKSARTKAKAGGARALKQPSWKRAAIQGAILAVAYFVIIQYVWAPKDAAGNRTANVWGSLLIAAIGFIAYTGIAYFVDRFNYNRKLRRLKGSEK